MSIAPKLEFKQSQNLTMTPQLRQAINLLQMSNIELNDMVTEELLSNPLLEKEDSFEEVENDPYKKDEEFANDVDYNNDHDDCTNDSEGYENVEEHSWSEYQKSKDNSNDDFDFFEKKLSYKKTLYDILEEQINIKFTNNQDKIIAINLTNNLDESGYFREDLAKTAELLSVKTAYIKDILSKLQTFEPSGIFAQNLQECLKIQLIELNRLDPIMEKLLDNLELLGAKNYKDLKKICNCTDEDLSSMITDIKSLNPKPAAEYVNNFNTFIIPDVFVRTNKRGDYLIELNQMSLPRVLLNQEYSASIKNNTNKETKKFYKDKLSSANFLIKALHQRATTVLKTSEEIVKYQKDFFEKGVLFLKPMALKDIAEKIEMHESTVSRVTTNKYMHTPRGTYELKYFFSSATNSLGNNEDTSSISIKHRIKELIEKESTDNILSDDKLVESLAIENIKIARRTVAKYRESMGIKTSAERKRLKRNQL